MAEQMGHKDFVQGWIEAEKKDHSDCTVVKAIAEFTDKNELNEPKLLAALKAIAKQEAEGDA